jgi:hypothetical protein
LLLDSVNRSIDAAFTAGKGIIETKLPSIQYQFGTAMDVGFSLQYTNPFFNRRLSTQHERAIKNRKRPGVLGRQY